MIRSIIVSLKYLGKEKNIKKYQNYKELRNFFLEKEVSFLEYKKLKISNFFTKGANLEEGQNYILKISSLDKIVMTKIIRILFLTNLNLEIINLYGENFIIKKIDFQNYFSREFKFSGDNKLYRKIGFKILTPLSFKVGEKFFSSLEPKYVFSFLLQQIKKSDFKNQYSYFKDFQFEKIKITFQETKETNMFEFQKGVIGNVVYELEKNASKKETFIFLFLCKLAFFSSLGVKTQEGYGQLDIFLLE